MLLERFIERFGQWVPGKNLCNPLETLKRILLKSTIYDIDSSHKVKKIINNGFKPAEYRCNSGWVFVILNEDSRKVVVTIEHK